MGQFEWKTIYIYISLLEWLGYSGPKELQKQGFLNLLERNSIAYISVGYLDPLIEQFPDIQEEINQMRVIDKPRKRWLIMDSKNFKEAIMSLTTKRSKEIRKYYLLLEELVQLYGAYTHQFKEAQLTVQLQEKDKQLQEKDEHIKDNEDHILLLKDLLIDDQKREKTQVVYIATSRNYANQNRFKPGGVESIENLTSRFSTYNSRSAAGDEWYYSDTFLVADYRQIDSKISWDVLGIKKARKFIFYIIPT